MIVANTHIVFNIRSDGQISRNDRHLFCWCGEMRIYEAAGWAVYESILSTARYADVLHIALQ